MSGEVQNTRKYAMNSDPQMKRSLLAPHLAPSRCFMTFESLISWDVPKCLKRPDSAAIYGTKKPMNPGLTGLFSTFLLVEPGGV